jgi:ligand-binding sensor domain-containing protein
MRRGVVSLAALALVARAGVGSAAVDFDRAEVLRAGEDVLALAQTADGFLWVGTGGGLFRHDGRELKAIPEVPRRRVTALAAAGNTLWVALDAPAAVGRLSAGAWVPSPLVVDQIRALAVSGDRAWVAGGGALHRVDGAQPARMELPAADGEPHLLGAASDGALLVATTLGVGRLGQRWELLWRSAGVRALQELAPGRLAVVVTGPDHRDVLYRLQLSEPPRALPVAGEVQLRALTADGAGGAWVGTRRGVRGLRESPDGVAAALSERAVLPQHEVK